jgi:hypothetical protein
MTDTEAAWLKNDILNQQRLENQHIKGNVLQWQPRKG